MERKDRIQELFEETIAMNPKTRKVFLSAVCIDDPTLKIEVEQMISLNEKATQINETPAPEVQNDATTQVDEKRNETKIIGHYKIIQEIGEGGMGAVYLAVRADDQYKQRVAIKLIKGGLDSDYTHRKFLSERQILASLSHPNIAKLLDGGTTRTGNPYLVMDYIEGLPIDKYCDQNKLSIEERLKLFRVVCSAVHYAHQNLIIHRDIKPSNIIVSADGIPRLLDFGIAKLLNPELSSQTLDLTIGGMGPMTPQYASPEQVRGGLLTTASDVYSLGVLLYELLTGHRPYNIKSRIHSDIALIVCEQEPERPSRVIKRTETINHGNASTQYIISPESISKTREGQPEKLRRRLKGDLDTIVLMALRKDAAKRYTSVEQFSEDIGRHLEGVPCIARKATPFYIVTKFIQRNKLGVVAATLLLITLFSGIVSTNYQRARAERRFTEVRSLANSFMFEIHDGIETLPGSTPVRQLLVTKALQYLDSLARESSTDVTLRRELATAYVKVGDIQGNPTVANLGDMEGALGSYQKALQIRQSLPIEDTPTPDAGLDLATSYDRVGDMFLLNHNIEKTTENYQKAFEIRQRLADKEPNQGQIRYDLSLSYSNMGDALTMVGDPSNGLENYRKALSIRQALLAQDSTNTKYRRSIAGLYYRMATRTFNSGDTVSGVEAARKSLAMFESLLQENPQNSKARRELALAHNNLGDLLWYKGDLKGATEEYRTGLDMREELLKADPTNMQARRDLAVSYNNYAYILGEKGKEEALILTQRNIEIMEGLLASNSNNANAMRDVAISYSVCADIYGMLAAQKNVSNEKRDTYYQSAIDFNQRSLKIWSDLRERGLLRYNDTVTPGKIEKSIVDYKKEIEKLKK